MKNAASKNPNLKATLSLRIGALLDRRWDTDGAGAARYGWYSLHACKARWEGQTLAEVQARLDAHDAYLVTPQPSA